MSVRVRRARLEDAAGLHRFAKELFAEQLDVIFRHPEPPSVEDQQRLIAELGTDHGGVLLVAEDAEQIVGMVGLRAFDRPQTSHGGSLGMSVHRARRRQGIGGRLAAAFAHWMDRQGKLRRAEAEVFCNNPFARRVLEGVGFVHEGLLRASVRIGDGFESVWLLARLRDDTAMDRARPADDEETRQQLEAMAEVVKAFDAGNVEHWLLGGWALDFLVGKSTRAHEDIDFFVWADSVPRAADLLSAHGFALVDGASDPTESLFFRRDDVWIELVLLKRRDDGAIVTPGRFSDWCWPSESFSKSRTTFSGVSCKVFDASGQAYVKRGYSSHGAKEPRRPKDSVDIGHLERLLGETD